MSQLILPRIAVLPERYGDVLSPCASIRLHLPLDALHRAGLAHVRFLILPEVEAFRPDAIVWQRVALRTTDEIGEIARIAEATGAVTIYDLDDHLLGMDDHPERNAYGPMIAAVRASLAVADRVWCSTANLALLTGDSAKGSTTVMPNTLDPELWEIGRYRRPLRSRQDGPFRLLYMGTRTHEDDFQFLAAVMEQLEAESPGAFQLHRIGVRGADGDGFPWLRVHFIPGHVGPSYPAFVHWLVRQGPFDLGVAPLMDNSFNAGKSPIKVLDYAAMGLPALASAVPAYLELRSGTECLHAPNNIDAWCEAVRKAAREPELCDHLREQAALRVTQNSFHVECRRRLEDVVGLMAGRNSAR